MGLGCGTPLAFAGLRQGETVLDLGSGGGLDSFLAAKQVGPGGKVIGVDMTPEMVAKARGNAQKVAAANVEFRLGEIERLPVADRTVDVVISNCVINLSLDRTQVLRDAFRVLRPGGRLAISDIVASGPLPDELRADVHAHAACVAGAPPIEELRAIIVAAGFVDVEIALDARSRTFIREWVPGSGAENYVASASITAVRPVGTGCCGTTATPSCC
jgi:SAM-dependent methyltransferase